MSLSEGEIESRWYEMCDEGDDDKDDDGDDGDV